MPTINGCVRIFNSLHGCALGSFLHTVLIMTHLSALGLKAAPKRGSPPKRQPHKCVITFVDPFGDPAPCRTLWCKAGVATAWRSRLPQIALPQAILLPKTRGIPLMRGGGKRGKPHDEGPFTCFQVFGHLTNNRII